VTKIAVAPQRIEPTDHGLRNEAEKSWEKRLRPNRRWAFFAARQKPWDSKLAASGGEKAGAGPQHGNPTRISATHRNGGAMKKDSRKYLRRKQRWASLTTRWKSGAVKKLVTFSAKATKFDAASGRGKPRHHGALKQVAAPWQQGSKGRKSGGSDLWQFGFWNLRAFAPKAMAPASLRVLPAHSRERERNMTIWKWFRTKSKNWIVRYTSNLWSEINILRSNKPLAVEGDWSSDQSLRLLGNMNGQIYVFPR
jgi:hypothetical protein